MTANELANIVDHWAWKESAEYLTDAATMLRQQQAELDAFKLNYYNTGYSLQLRDKDETIKLQQAEIEALKLCELSDEEIDKVWAETCSDFKLIENGKTKGIINIYDVSRAILKKAREK